MESSGDLIVRIADDYGGGANSPFNYKLYCGYCQQNGRRTLLGLVGTFLQRKDHRGAFRRAHCPLCHATTYIRPPALLEIADPVMVAGKCGQVECPSHESRQH